MPADDYTDPAPFTTFTHLDATTELSRADRRARHLPGRRPAGVDLDASSRPRSSASATTTCARRVQEVLQRYKELQDIIAILGLDELSEEDRVIVSAGPARSSGSCRSRSSWARCSPASRASTCRSRRRSSRFEQLVNGELDDLPEQAFFNVGGADDALAQGQAARSRPS